jgi:PAS domain S-box-containing protein
MTPSTSFERSATDTAFRRFSLLAALALGLAGAVLIYGWQVRLPAVVNSLPNTPINSPNTGLALILAALSLGLSARLGAREPLTSSHRRLLRWTVTGIALFLLVLGGATLIEYATGLDLGIDQVLMQNLTQDPVGSGRMSLPAAAGTVLAGLALLTLDLRLSNGHYPAEYLALTIIGIMAVPLIGYLFSVTSMPYEISSQGVAPQSAVLYLVLGLALLTVRPRHRVMDLWNSDGPGARLVRQLLPKSLLLLLILFLLVDGGARKGWYGYDKVSPLVILLAGAWLSALFWRAGALLNREHEERRSHELALSETSHLLRAVSDNTPDAIYVKDRAGRMVFANPATARLLGWGAENLVGKSSAELFSDPEDAQLVEQHDREVMQSGRAQAIEERIRRPEGVRTLYSTKSPWLDAEGRTQGVVGISTDITDRKRVEDALREHEVHLERLVQERTAEVTELIGHLENTREEEKRAIARELHDDLGSALTALSMHFAILLQKLSDPALTERAQQIKALLAAVTQTTRRIQVGLRPDKLDIFGIKTAISEQCLEFEKYSGVACSIDLPDEELSWAPPTEIALYRMVQEALNNIAKHARASQVQLTLDDSEDGIVLTIRDNGVGFARDAVARKLTHGLRGMRERAQYLGGTFSIKSTGGAGSTIVIHLPRTQGNRGVNEPHREAG